MPTTLSKAFTLNCVLPVYSPGAVGGYGRQVVLVVPAQQVSVHRVEQRLHSPHIQSRFGRKIQSSDVVQL